MTVQARSVAVFLMFVMVALATSTTAAAKSPKKSKKATVPAPVTLQGVVQVDKNARGKVTAVALVTPLGERLSVAVDATARKLASMVDQNVEIVATEKHSKKRGMTYRVKSFKALPAPVPEEDDEDEYVDEGSDEETWDPDEEGE